MRALLLRKGKRVGEGIGERRRERKGGEGKEFAGPLSNCFLRAWNRQRDIVYMISYRL